MSWDNKKIEILKNEWGKGKTALQIAELIGGVSRNAVIGKAHRLSLSSKITEKTGTSINGSKNNSEKFWVRLAKKYRFVIMTDDSFEERLSLKVNRLNLLIFGAVVVFGCFLGGIQLP